MSVSPSFDLLLRGGRVICPASGIDGIRDVAVRNGKIAAVQADILPSSAKEVVDVVFADLGSDPWVGHGSLML